MNNKLMRPIEFRGFSLSDKQWKYGYYYVNTLGMHNIVCPDGHTLEVYQGSIGQYTGLKDKNGVKIYEWDIYKDQKGISHLVTFQLGAFCGGVNPCISAPLGYYASEEDIDIDPDPDFSMTIEVIGNAYEHPNLLQQ